MTNFRTLIQSYASAQIAGLLGKIKASSKLGHRLTKAMGDVRAEIALAMHVLHERPPL